MIKKLGAIALTGVVGMSALLGLPVKAQAEDMDKAFGICGRAVVDDHATERGGAVLNQRGDVVSYVAASVQNHESPDSPPLGKTVMISKKGAGSFVSITDLPYVGKADKAGKTPEALAHAVITMSGNPGEVGKLVVIAGSRAAHKKAVVKEALQMEAEFLDCMRQMSSMEPSEVSPFYQPLASAQAESTKAKIEAYANAYELRPVDKAAAKRVLKAGVNGSMLELKR